MTEVRHGTITLTIPEQLTLPENAGRLSPAEVARIPRAPRGIGLACAHAADALEKAGSRFTAPNGVSKSTLLEAAERADGIDQVIVDVEVALTRLKQANLLFDAAAWELLRKLHDQAKTQGKHDPELLTMFKPVLDFFARGPRRPKTEPEAASPSPGKA